MPKIDAGRKVNFLIASSKAHDLPLAYPVREHGCGESRNLGLALATWAPASD